jgi:tetratricopeptide (TPR) repeat protein
MGDLEQAISDYSSAVQIEPNLALTYYNRGNVYLTKEKPEQAILDYSEAIRINSFLVSAYLNRSRAYFLKKEYSKSWEDVRKVKALGYDTDQNFLEELKKASGIGE